MQIGGAVMTKQQKIALIQEMLMELPKAAAPMIRAKEQLSSATEERLTHEEWECILEWLDEVKSD
jgi:hypothetical protein